MTEPKQQPGPQHQGACEPHPLHILNDGEQPELELEAGAEADGVLPKSYDHGQTERELFGRWLAGDYFSRGGGGFAEPGKPSYTIVIPPPNVTGVLHMGHALNNTLQDILTRRARMQGHPTRWIVGTDHAGIATQNKVEQKLAAEGKTRFDLGREDFVQACWQWRRQYGSTIIEQLKRMGCSCDYADEQFTMDDDYAAAIRRVFVQWFDAGLIYRGNRIINWCPRCTTALADDEVEHHDEAGQLWHLRYPLVEPVGGLEYLVVATTRPETMLGDSGVAVSPDDQRYAALLAAGAKLRLPLVGREIPLFADDYVDAGFGTGAVKVTPAHDPNDFEMGQRHGLEQINIFSEAAVVNANGGRFAGMTREQARGAVLDELEQLGLLDHVEEHGHAVGHCYRCDTTIEPWLSEQWFVSMKPLAVPAIQAVRDGRVRFNPKRWENVYFQWMENIRDWCISRQLWWGHRIPVFYCDSCGWMGASEQDLQLCPQCGAALRQDEDVLDTWFSSQLWPFATQGWPLRPGWHDELACYYPTQVLSTARDIIFLWVARMIISSMYFLGGPGAGGLDAKGSTAEGAGGVGDVDKGAGSPTADISLDGAVPFEDVIIHPTVLDKHGNIMSKSRGNGIDPLELIGEYGADAMRFGLAMQITGSQDMKFDKDKIMTMARNFSTKIWNAARYVSLNLTDFSLEGLRDSQTGRVTPLPATDADRWILSRLARLVAELAEDAPGAAGEDAARVSGEDAPRVAAGTAGEDVSGAASGDAAQPATDGSRRYDFGAISRMLYRFFWSELCDWYIEFSKSQLASGGQQRQAAQRNLVFVLDTALRLLHPIMPFITERIWLSLPHGDSRPSLMVAAWPKAEDFAQYIDTESEQAVDALCAVVGALRAARARYGISPKQPLRVVVRTTGERAADDARLLLAQAGQLQAMANAADFEAAPDAAKPEQSSVTVAAPLEIFVVLEGFVDFAAERARLVKERDKKRAELEKLEKKLANQGFMAKADASVVTKAKNDAASLALAIEQLDAQIADLQ